MAEYLHLYDSDNDYDLRGSTYHVTRDGWVPAIMPPWTDLDVAMVTESIEVMVTATTAAGVETAIGALRALLAEAERKTRLYRYAETGVYLRHIPDSGSTADYRTAEVVAGTVRRQKVAGARTGQAASSDYKALVVLEVQHRCPRGEQEILKNVVLNESFEYDTNSDGLANDWEKTGDTGGITASIVAVSNAYGSYGQRVRYIGSTANTGIRTTDTITVAAETEYLLQAWMDNNSSIDTCRVAVYDVSNGAWIAASYLNWTAGETASLKTVTFDTPASCTQVRVYSVVPSPAEGEPDWIVDAVYFGATESTVPQGWSSNWLLENHEDGAARSTDRNWLLVANVPGDAEAELYQELQFSAGLDAVIVGRRSDSQAWLPVCWLQAEDIDAWGTGLTTDTDANASGPATSNVQDWNYVSVDNTYLQWRKDDADEVQQLRGRYRAILFARTTASTTLNITWRMSVQYGTTEIYSEYVTREIGEAWRWQRGPVVSFPARTIVSEADEEALTITLYAAFDSTAYEVRFDGLLLVAIDEDWMDVPVIDNAWEIFKLLASGPDQALAYESVVYGNSGALAHEAIMRHLAPSIPQRLTYLFGSLVSAGETETYLWYASRTSGVTLKYWPRYLSL